MDREKIFDAFRNCITEPKCKDCPWESCEKFNQAKIKIPLDLCLDILKLLKEQEHKDKMFHALEDDWKRLKELLKEQEVKTGKWIEQTDYMGDTYYDCSVCNESWTTIEGTPWVNGMNYCPHCGAKMIDT